MLGAQSGLALSVRNLSTMGAIVFGTTVVSGMGTASLAAHEILRQARPCAACACRLGFGVYDVGSVHLQTCLGPSIWHVLPLAMLSNVCAATCCGANAFCAAMHAWCLCCLLVLSAVG